MKRVNVLPPSLVSKIAAGEVIDRAASVVKELIENSLDAGSTDIRIDIKQAGQELIHITDNGHGIACDDLEKVFLRHATSKIATFDDLYAISSLGFRGEALYSVAAIADVILRTKTPDADMGWEIHVRGGEILGKKPVSMNRGTEIHIKELFYNTPVRRKFLKTQVTEFKQIVGAIIPHAIANPTCAFTLTHNHKNSIRTIIDSPVAKSTIARIAQILNISQEHIVSAKKIIQNRDVSFTAFLGDSNLRRSSKDIQFIFINGRPVAHRLINYQLNEMYRALLPQQVYPFFTLFLDVPSEDIDVNIHPAKKEVKITHEFDLASQIRRICEDTLLTQTKAKQIVTSAFTLPEKNKQHNPQSHSSPKKETSDSSPLSRYEQKSLPYTAAAIREPRHTTYEPAYMRQATEHLLEPVETSFEEQKNKALGQTLSESRFIGAFHKKYLLFESGQSLLIVDQHAAQERVTFEIMKKQIAKGNVEVQHLLAPITLPLTPQELLAWEHAELDLNTLGFSLSRWDKETIAIHAHPQLIADPEFAIRNVLSGDPHERCNVETIARRACRASIMAGDSINRQGAETLRKNLMECKEPFTCPHGRPTIVEMQESFLNKQFLRG